jgi:hypothetical protein
LVSLPLLLVTAGWLWLGHERRPQAPHPTPPWRRTLRAPPAGGAEGGAVEKVPAAPGPAAGRRAGVGALPQMWLHPGDLLRSEPRPDAPVVTESTVYANVGILRRRGEWRLVRWGADLGWVPARQQAPMPADPAPVLPVPARPADPQRVAAARRLLGEGGRELRAGPYPLYTDVVDPGLLLLLDRAAAGLEDAYRARYGLRPLPGTAEVVVLFAREEDYRRYLQQIGEPTHAAGHVGHGVVTLWRQGRLSEVVRATLVHELVHLLNRRAIGPALPPWLDEGLATDLAESQVGEGGRLLPGTLAEVTVRTGERVEWHLGAASRELLREAVAHDRLPSLAALTGADLDGFRAVQPPALAYAESAFLVRHLLASEHAAAFRGFLAAVAAGGEPAGEAMRESLGVSWEELERGLRASFTASPPDAVRSSS